MDKQKAERPSVENETSKANRTDVKGPALMRDNAKAVGNMRENTGKPWDQRDWEQMRKDDAARSRYGDHNQLNGGGTYKRGAIYNED
jgi:hypothetical protein